MTEPLNRKNEGQVLFITPEVYLMRSLRCKIFLPFFFSSQLNIKRRGKLPFPPDYQHCPLWVMAVIIAFLLSMEVEVVIYRATTLYGVVSIY